MAHQSLTGSFLVALPGLGGDYFEDSLILLAEHSPEGSLGLVLNKPANVTLTELLEEPGVLADLPVMLGGPVATDQLYFLHSNEREYAGTHAINEEISLSTSAELLDEQSLPSYLQIFVGYAGWSAGQLEQELSEDVWLLAPFSTEVLFYTTFAEQPEAAAAKIGIDLNLLGSSGGQH